MTNSKNQALATGTVLSGTVYTYVIERVLGQGAFGITYLASTNIKGPLGEVTVPVAVKEFFAKDLDSRGEDGTVSSRTNEGVAFKYAKAFRRESENLSKMKHPGIVKVLEAFEAKGTYYYSMEYLPGGSLDDKVKGAGMSEEEALPMIKRIGEAISFMHGRKMMHLDLKSKNIMRKGDGSPVVIDFGLSKQYDDNGEPESSTTIGMGTPGYAPIEQSTQTASGEFQPTLDIYALGATLYKMLTGTTPPSATLILNKKASLIPALQSKDVSPGTISAIRQAMFPLMDDRPQTVPAFLSMLGRSPAGETGMDDQTDDTLKKGTTKKSPVPPPDQSKEKKPKTWLWALLAGIAVLALALAVILGGRRKPVTPVGQQDTLVVVPITVPGEKPDTAPVTSNGPVASGSLKVSSTPSGASIWLDGKDTKKTTPEILEDLTPGQRSIKLALEGYEDYSGKVTITSGKLENLAKTLSAKEVPPPKEDDPSPQVVPEQPITPPADSKPTIGRENGHEWVDLGLSVKWATCNVGASSPEGYGNYYAWGETRTKGDYSWETLRFRVSGDSGEHVTFSKYNTKSEHGPVDNKTRLDLSDDAARQNWGGRWRTPTKEEWEELSRKCTWTWTTQGGKNGYKVTGENGNSIFFPAAGRWYGSSLFDGGSYGYYWSSSLYTDYPYYAWYVSFDSGVHLVSSYRRLDGHSVRPVTK